MSGVRQQLQALLIALSLCGLHAWRATTGLMLRRRAAVALNVVQELQQQQVQQLAATCELPQLLTGVFTGLDTEAFCERLVDDLAEEYIRYQIRDAKDGYTELYDAPLIEFIEGLQEESSLDRSWYLLTEDLLETHAPDLQSQLQLPEDSFGADLFALFPTPVRPKRGCLIIGGTGSRSFLHADPYEWLGWNVLMEGTKLWTFLPPCSETELQGQRVEPNAWGALYNVSAGWQSPIDLYRHLEVLPSPADSRSSTRPPIALQSGVPDHLWQQRIEIVQREGDVVLIPARWWHQVIHLEPSIAVAGQHMNAQNSRRVLQHMRDWCGLGQAPFPDDFDLWTPPAQIEHVLREALAAQHGAEEGEFLYAQLVDAPHKYKDLW